MKLITVELDANSNPVSCIIDDNGTEIEFVIQRKGRWIQDGIYDRCSVCDKLTIMPHLNGMAYHDFCPRCGSKNTRK